MDKYTMEYLRNMTDDNLSDIATAIMDKPKEFTEEEKQIIYDKFRIYIMLFRHLDEYLSNIGREVEKKEYDALKEAYLAYEYGNWDRCKSTLREFFQYSDLDADIPFYASVFSYSHLLRWWGMLINIKNIDSEVEFSSLLSGISEVLNERMLQELKLSHWSPFKKPAWFRSSFERSGTDATT